jgi:hypothetical protein
MKRTPLKRTSSLRRQVPVRRRNARRLKRLRELQFGVQAQLCRESRCCNCGDWPPSDPHHVKSRGAGGRDDSTIPLCRACHQLTHTKPLPKRVIDEALATMRRRVAERNNDDSPVSPLLGMVAWR